MNPFIKAFGLFLSPTARKFQQALSQPQRVQATVQKRLIQKLKNCEYGQRYNIRTRADWHRLPIVSYEDLQSYIPAHSTDSQSLRKVRNSSLTPDPILFYEPTSGSSGPIKYIPYTRSLRKSFNHLFCIWAHDLITHGPAFSTGKFYFSISPSFSKTSSAGTADDSDYLDPWLRWLLSPFLVIAPLAPTPESFKDNLAKTLLQSEQLEIISVWSPSFLTAQLDYIQQNQQRLCEELGDKLSAARSHLLCQPNIPWSQLWPNLKLISCWDSVTAADGAAGLRSHFPNTLVQGKGLLATEAPLTVPLIAAKGHVPLLGEVFFEFEDSQGRCHELHELTVGETYEVIISQMGGLYRYRMGDRVRVTHYFLQTPCLKFVGRGKGISDLVGEKLNAQFVSHVLNRLELSEASFQSLVPVREPKPHYALLLDRAEGDLEAIAQQLETLLCQSYHYKLARQLEQLDSARLFVSANIAEILSAKKATSGQNWGDIKHEKLEAAIRNLAWGISVY
ncbi:GH3 auxin-responsive promoter family protein [cf. Phormidesmis sp. LEGE 11477]|uniref:GH3 family domain-containing protein n=1 Tax=cf. Phormidesmis sp. LEGE 11477 TaxID=1828680 RepID=UPI0018804CBC|nr:GH3 auxin-responsive promoter family protein [cf. Phormidesmis sp. LEGE 11477]MBE9063703.1 GH3 auxin-responsive promoter family protein [cf. Phormidesmis sp. LEGE 11477]